MSTFDNIQVLAAGFLAAFLAVSCGQEEASNRPRLPPSAGAKASAGDGSGLLARPGEGSVVGTDVLAPTPSASATEGELEGEPATPATANRVVVVLDCGARMEWLVEKWPLSEPLREWVGAIEEQAIVDLSSVYAVRTDDAVRLMPSSVLSLDSSYSALCAGEFGETGLGRAIARLKMEMMKKEATRTVLLVVTDGASFANEMERSALAKSLEDAQGIWVGAVPAKLSGRHHASGSQASPRVGKFTTEQGEPGKCGPQTRGSAWVRPTAKSGAFSMYDGGSQLVVLVAAFGNAPGDFADAELHLLDKTLRAKLLADGLAIRLYPVGMLSGGCALSAATEGGDSTAGDSGVIVSQQTCAVHCSSPKVRVSVRLAQEASALTWGEAEADVPAFALARTSEDPPNTSNLLLVVPAQLPVRKVSVEDKAFALAPKAKDKAQAAVSVSQDGVLDVNCSDFRKWRCANQESSQPEISVLGDVGTVPVTEFVLPQALQDISTDSWDAAPCDAPFLTQAVGEILRTRLKTAPLSMSEPVRMKLKLLTPACEPGT